jgi:hypothetical protein
MAGPFPIASLSLQAEETTALLPGEHESSAFAVIGTWAREGLTWLKFVEPPLWFPTFIILIGFVGSGPPGTLRALMLMRLCEVKCCSRLL